MAEIIKMPKMSDTMTEGIIISWLKKVGDKIKSGDILAEVETDKATMELESYDDGTLLYIGAKENDRVPVGSILAIIGKDGEEYKSLLKESSPQESSPSEKQQNQAEPKDSENETNIKPSETYTTPSPTEIKSENTTLSTNEQQPLKVPQQIKQEKNITTHENYNESKEINRSERVIASPLAKRIATEMKFDLNKVQGSGPSGRIIKRDLKNVDNTNSSGSITKDFEISTQEYNEEQFEDITISSMRQTIAKKLTESLAQAPHFYLTMDVNMDKAMEIRSIINNGSKEKISFNDIITKAVSMAIRTFPKVNVSWLGDKIRYNKHIHIGIAVAIDNGLVVPTLKFTDTKTLSRISSEIKILVEKAKSKNLALEEMQGSTFCISNLGMFGIESFTSIINPPSACILAIGAIKKIPICNDNGSIVSGNVMKLTLSCDHRAVDGAIGAEFMSVLKKMLEEPVSILI